jgi:HlyD family secretion protein
MVLLKRGVKIMRKYVLLIIALILLVLSGCNTGKSNKVVFAGNLEGDTTNVSAESSGKVTGIIKKEGSTVKAGDIVYTLDDTMLQLQKSQLEIQIKGLEVQLKMAEDKGNDDSIKLAQYNVDSMKKSLEMVEENIKRCTVLAPIDGVIVNENFKKGEIVLQSNQLFNIMDNSKYYLKIFVPEKYLSKFNVEDKLQVYLSSQTDKYVTGQIVKIDTSGQFTPKNVETVEDKSNIVYGIKIAIDVDENIKPGMIAEVKVDE